jgi:16S rRNA (uracil1498-N3)-methyltransferase
MVSLCFGLSNRDKVELILQKATEVGVSAFHPFISSRSLVQKAALSEKKYARWQRIIREAAEQSGRGQLPDLHQPRRLEECAQAVRESHARMLVAWEKAETSQDQDLSSHLAGQVESLALFVGPEGGFSREEIQNLQASGCEVVSLGARILRMETAAIIFPALVLYELGAL